MINKPYTYERLKFHTKYWRFFKLSFTVTKDVHGKPIEPVDIVLKPEYEFIGDLSKGTHYICVSDARTHVERLVFPALPVLEKSTHKISYCVTNYFHIAGEMTMMIYGGDPESIHEPEFYIKQLWEANKK